MYFFKLLILYLISPLGKKVVRKSFKPCNSIIEKSDFLPIVKLYMRDNIHALRDLKNSSLVESCIRYTAVDKYTPLHCPLVGVVAGVVLSLYIPDFPNLD